MAGGITRTATEIETGARGLASGDLDQKVNIWSTDELGRMAAAFRQMMAYHQGMASIADAIAAGDLTADVQPHSSQDRLGIALRGMVGNLRSLVVGLEDRSAQV